MGDDAPNVLSLSWVFGFSRDIAIQNLCDENRSAIFYVSAHTGIIHDISARTQKLLQGHCNPISCTCSSSDRRWVITADKGPESMLVIWDSYMGTPIKTIQTPHANGVCAMDLSPDGRYLVTLSEETNPQVLSIWDCASANEKETPLYSAQVAASANGAAAEPQTAVRFDPEDSMSLVTNGSSLVVFWSFHDGGLKFQAPSLAERDFKQPVGRITQTVFIPGTRNAVSATADGDAMLWELVSGPEDPLGSEERRASKMVKLHSGPIHYLMTVGPYLVSGGADGHVRFFDFNFRVVAWFEDLEAGPISSISFAHQPSALKTHTVDSELSCPDFIIGTANALIVACSASLFDQLEPSARRGTLLVQGQDFAVSGLATHPSLTRFAVTGRSGLLQLWDYAERRLLIMRMYDKLLGNAVAFSPNGKFLAVGFTNGAVKVLAAMTLEEIASFKASKDCILQVHFSHDSNMLATSDADNCVGVYRHGSGTEEGGARYWEFLGKYRGHYKTITGLGFGQSDEGLPRLFSTAEDRHLVEYDLARSSVQGGVQLRSTTRIEQTAVPTAFLWLPPGVQGSAATLVTANEQYKLRCRQAGGAIVERTALGPTYGGPLTRMLLLPSSPEDDNDDRYIAYATHEKVVGIMKLPLDGNPNKAMGLIAHPGEVADLCSSWDGKWLVTAGGSDMSIHLWSLDVLALEETIKSGGEGLAPFAALIDGGADGPAYQEMVDYFYYAQLRTQGEDTTEPRRITGLVPIGEVGNLMRSLGYYPSEKEVEDLMAEAQLMGKAAGREDLSSITFDEFLRLYVNHRPVFGISKEQINEAFETIGVEMDGKMPREALLRALAQFEEGISGDDLAQCLRALMGTDDVTMLNKRLGSKDFAEDVLGFDDYAPEQAK
ncbi:hypothetical protein AB1Y20_009940 [Prymnesium parvum]|uniref:Cilia- and flagella-associated protein 251 n=1 Tax=Prymnesium parvum TaxID=97485 RepID=A0AB34K5Z7_PRYPA